MPQVCEPDAPGEGRVDGHDGDYPAELKDGAFVWSMEHPQAGHIRYTIRVKDGRWSETGESSRDGVSWTPIFEMTLTRDSSAG